MSVVSIENPDASKLILGLGLAGMLMTPEEFDAIDEADENYKYELIHGVLVVTPPPLEEERGPNERLGNLLYLYQTQNPQGSAVDDTLTEQHIPTPDSRRRADRVIWAGLGRAEPTEGPTGDRRRVRLGREKELAPRLPRKTRRVPCRGHSRILDYRPLRPHHDCLQARWPGRRHPQNGRYQTPLLPGFELPLAALLTVADRWRVSKQQ